MKFSRLSLIILILGVVLSFSFSIGRTADLSRQALQLQEKIEKRSKEINRLRSRREQLEKTARQQSRELKKYEIQFRHYLANLENSERRAQTLDQELLNLLERSRKREMFLDAACPLVAQHPGNEAENLREVVIGLVTELYQQELRERPISKQLREKIDKEQSYQRRIRERYMVNDQVRRDKTQKQLESAKNRAKTSLETEQRIATELQDLKRRLAALDEQLSRLRKQSRKPRGPGQTAQTPFQPGRPFIQLKGRLPWPARGKIVRGYGPFTHPSLGVKLKNKGIDVSVKRGAPLKAVADGRVLYVGELESYGSIIALDHGGGYLTVCGNVKPEALKIGQVVSAGTRIGIVGQGDRKGNSVYHFEIRHGDQSLDPSAWLAR